MPRYFRISGAILSRMVQARIGDACRFRRTWGRGETHRHSPLPSGRVAVCGRFVVTSAPTLLVQRFGVDDDQVGASPPDYNIAPRAAVMALRERVADGRHSRVLSRLRWGFVPGTATDSSAGDRLINVRSEGLATRSSFRPTLARRRCIIPADGFYEWTPQGARKQPVFVRRQDAQPLALAGLWAVWKIPEDHPLAATRPDGWLRTCTILTTASRGVLAAVHHRMPVVVPESWWDRWLDPTLVDPMAFDAVFNPHDDDGREDAGLELWPVSPLVNRAENNAPELIAPIEVARPLA